MYTHYIAGGNAHMAWYTSRLCNAHICALQHTYIRTYMCIRVLHRTYTHIYVRCNIHICALPPAYIAQSTSVPSH